MVDERQPAPAHVTPQHLWDAIEKVRAENRVARHEQTNQITRAMADAVNGIESRLRSLETVIAGANITQVGPRLSDLERWRDRADAGVDGGLPKRIDALDAELERRRGVLIAVGVLATISGIGAAIATIVTFVVRGLP